MSSGRWGEGAWESSLQDVRYGEVFGAGCNDERVRCFVLILLCMNHRVDAANTVCINMYSHNQICCKQYHLYGNQFGP